MHLKKSIAGLCMLATAVLAAENPFLGTWKLNVSKSTFSPDHKIKNMTMIFKSEDGKIRRIAEGIDGQDKPIMQGGPGGDLVAWDGKQHRESPEGAPTVDITINPVVNGATDVTVKMQGKVVSRVHAAVADDGRTLTEVQHNPDKQGRLINSVLVFDKQ